VRNQGEALGMVPSQTFRGVYIFLPLRELPDILKEAHPYILPFFACPPSPITTLLIHWFYTIYKPARYTYLGDLDI
jgi:hypothetical protein